MDFGAKFQAALSYRDFLDQYASPQQRAQWDAFHDTIKLSEEQRALLKGFRRQQRVLCLAGCWCGDCVEQCPIFDHFQLASSLLEVRYQDRDSDMQLQQELKICGGARVPAVVFLCEENYLIGRYGDRTISKYRQMVAPSSGLMSPEALTTAVIQDWLLEFERIQWILRTSPRLRKKHGD